MGLIPVQCNRQRAARLAAALAILQLACSPDSIAVDTHPPDFPDDLRTFMIRDDCAKAVLEKRPGRVSRHSLVVAEDSRVTIAGQAVPLQDGHVLLMDACGGKIVPATVLARFGSVAGFESAQFVTIAAAIPDLSPGESADVPEQQASFSVDVSRGGKHGTFTGTHIPPFHLERTGDEWLITASELVPGIGQLSLHVRLVSSTVRSVRK